LVGQVVVMQNPALQYQMVGDHMDRHIDQCQSCSAGVACRDGDAAATGEYRAWRTWLADDPAAARRWQHDSAPH
jgi:hypothetical protein